MLKEVIKLFKRTFNLSAYKVVTISNDSLVRYNSELQTFESHFTYPISTTQRFKIVHGDGDQKGYLDFFKSLGLVKFFIALEKNHRNQKEPIVGAACAVLRKIRENSGSFKKVWYLCDLKVIPEHQGKNVPLLLFLRILRCSFHSTNWYGISMNSHPGKNKLASYLKKQGFNFKERILNFYFFEAEEIVQHRVYLEDILKKHGFSGFYFKDNRDLKSFQLFDVKDPSLTAEWKILHMQYGKSTHSYDPVSGYVHMLATFDGTLFDTHIKALEKQPSTTATVMSKGVELPDIKLTNEV